MPKTDKEGNIANTVACSMSPVVFDLPFQCRLQAQILSVEALLSGLFESHGSDVLISSIFIADCVCRKRISVDLIFFLD